MLRPLHLAAVLVLTSPIDAVGGERYSSPKLISDSQWTPVSRERVFGDFERNLKPRNDFPKTYNGNLHVPAANRVIFNDGEDTSRPYGSRYVDDTGDWNSKRTNNPDGTVHNQDTQSFAEITTTSYVATHRKAKAVSTDYTIDDINNLVAIDSVKEAHDVIRDNDSKAAPGNDRYEVIEGNETEADVGDDFVHVRSSSRPHDEPSAAPGSVAGGGGGWTSELLGVLSKYNIGAGPPTSNYGISRTAKRIPPRRAYILLPIPIRLSSTYNAKYLAVDPLFNLILSNYGHILPDQYELRSNAYGKVVSNNIYNNEPFGSYRIYADTDSSQ